MRLTDLASPHKKSARRTPTDMSTPNPLAPQGSLLEQQAKGKSTFHVISFIGAVHVMLLSGILWTACRPDEKPKVETPNTIGAADPYAAAPLDATGGAPISNVTSNLANTLPPPPSTTLAPGNPTTPPGYGSTPGTSPTPAPITTIAPPLPPSTTPTPAPGSANLVENATGTGGDYTVVKGDIGESIAKKHGVTMKSLALANPDVNWSRLKISQPLKIPAASAPAAPTPIAGHEAVSPTAGVVYTVKAGDTGTRIATKHGVKWVEIRRANKLKSDSLHPGQKLTIPAHAGAAPTGDGSAGTTPVPVPAGGTLQPTAIPATRGPGQ